MYCEWVLREAIEPHVAALTRAFHRWPFGELLFHWPATFDGFDRRFDGISDD
jgi:hypothetical protein